MEYENDIENFIKMGIELRFKNFEKEKENALNAFLMALEIMDVFYKSSAHMNYVKCFLNIGEIYLWVENNDVAKSYFLKAIDILNIIDSECTSEERIACYDGLYQIYVDIDDYDTAYEYLEKMMIIRSGFTCNDEEDEGDW